MGAPVKCCRNCANVVKYSSNRYECMKSKVAPNGTCDRFTRKQTSAEVMRKIDEAMKKLESYEDGTYHLRELPNYGENYHIIGDKES